ncbi:hypothetical protein ARMSODRAFT_126752 [Armillaria solidipes]|uniref:Uncharacterized protein n=1 Tax=Armillaria solidipes TaxID=1076256 RepID=A0A2H3BVR3_9AGAR|nr:hypothetical protein ARMSODRAFT_126752 [Armillaria solidipes]
MVMVCTCLQFLRESKVRLHNRESHHLARLFSLPEVLAGPGLRRAWTGAYPSRPPPFGDFISSSGLNSFEGMRRRRDRTSMERVCRVEVPIMILIFDVPLALIHFLRRVV